jgi:hypothetical protein
MIQYRFQLQSGTTFCFDVDLERSYTAEDDQKPRAAWTRLDFHQCPVCPLAGSKWQHCPAAADVEPIIGRFKSTPSYERAHVEVETPERTFRKLSDVQTGLRSLFGLVMATSGCPVLSRFKGLAHFHLPFATVDETLFRTTSAYLIKQYFLARQGASPDLALAGLDQQYRDVYEINRYLSYRFLAASEMDANVNAVGTFASISQEVSFSVQDQLKALKEKLLPEPNEPTGLREIPVPSLNPEQ